MKPSISSHKLLALMKNNHVTILDVRGQDEFKRGHIFGSLNIPVDDLLNRYNEVPNDRVIVTYCGKGGGRSERAAKTLIENGKNSFWLEGGYLDWPFFSPNSPQKEEPMIFHQLFEKESSSYTYLLADPITCEAIIIDPVLETVERDLKLIQELDLNLLYILETHIHADHITGSSELKKHTGAKSAVSKKAGVCCADLELEENYEIKFGRYTLKILETPGHTDESLSFVCEKMIFTGDSLMIRGTGRTDFQNGSSEVLYESIHKKIFSLPDNTKIYPAHDYKGLSFSTVLCEKEFNTRVGAGKTKEEFIAIMNDLKLADPKKIYEAIPANLACGNVRP